MKTINKLGVLALIVMTGLMTACNRGSGGGSVGGGGGPGGFGFGNPGFGAMSCGNCGSARDYLITALGQAPIITEQGMVDLIQLGLDIYIDGRGAFTPDGTLMTIFQNYQGPIGAAGELAIQHDYSSCGLPPGVYQLRTAQPGNYIGFNQFNGLVLEGRHVQMGIPIVVALNASSNNYITYLTNPSASWNGIPYNYKIQKTMTIVSAGNMPCNGGVYELY